MTTFLLTDVGLFLGRFHPLLVHLPIGFLLLAVVLEWWPGDKLRPAVRITWMLGALAAVAAAGCGWLLAAEAGEGDTLFWHRWLGVSVAVLAVLGIWLTKDGGTKAKAYGLVVATLLGVAGHQGGNLTHGDTYLVEHAPAVVQRVAGYDGGQERTEDWSRVNTDSINLYTSFLEPALATSCVKCHNAGKQNGDLRMDKAHLLFAGGDGGAIIAPGNPLESEWLRRVTLPRSNVKAMPPQGEPWDYTTVALLEYWIAEGADTLALLSPEDTPDGIKALLQRDYGLDLRPKLFVETISAPALAPEKRSAIEELNWSVSNLRPDGGAVEVKVRPGRQLATGALQQLAEAAPEQVSYLSLDRLALSDDDLQLLTRFPNLNRLRLNGTRVTEATVAKLSSLRHLESLNLYGTDVGDAVFDHLAKLPALKRVYLWQTNVSPEAAEAFAKAHPHVSVDTGFTFAPVTDEQPTK